MFEFESVHKEVTGKNSDQAEFQRGKDSPRTKGLPPTEGEPKIYELPEPQKSELKANRTVSEDVSPLSKVSRKETSHRQASNHNMRTVSDPIREGLEPVSDSLSYSRQGDQDAAMPDPEPMTTVKPSVPTANMSGAKPGKNSKTKRLRVSPYGKTDLKLQE